MTRGLTVLFAGFISVSTWATEPTQTWIPYDCRTQGELEPLPSSDSFHLAGQIIEGQNDAWPKEMWHELTYCVNPRFKGATDMIRQSFAEAALDWMEVANVTFTEIQTESCTFRDRGEALFFITPVSRRSRFNMRAFFPSYDEMYFRIQVNRGKLDKFSYERIRGIFRHEIGHVLGFRHEHVHPEATVDRELCPMEGGEIVAITDYDRYSVMHYGRCGGKNGFYSRLSELDKVGAALYYPFE